jgi:hypothetical protein
MPKKDTGTMATMCDSVTAPLRIFAGILNAVVVSLTARLGDLLTWVDFTDSSLIGFGTDKKLYVYEGGVNYDVTPIISETTATNALNTTSGSTRIVVSATGTGVQDGDYVAFTSQTVTVGGNIFLDDITEAYEVSVIAAGRSP